MPPAARIGFFGMFNKGPFFASIPRKDEDEEAKKKDPHDVYKDDYLTVIKYGHKPAAPVCCASPSA